ncbi:SOS response-associated peptidase [Cohnella faecalis]|uniref:Abasic site processing protein n=1 Tax=Cohnella faecalis TaxID=2315694 RepID=A0A398CZR8_9BACL|nr:SOS response-associated peptidase [Cohnella faecalis]RIE04414.1 SOS response-associated peptidase [Cohnella faecalis]
MCGRYTVTVTLEELMALYLAEGTALPFNLPRFNFAPTQLVPAIVNDGTRNRIGQLKWGLVPSWAEDEKVGIRMINARAESLDERPAFRTAYRRKRCLIPADGFYEWKTISGGKQPYRIKLRNGELFGMAGLYETWTSPDGRKVHTCTVITTTPNRLMEDIHHRMPVILRREDEALWLDRSIQDPSRLQPLLAPYPAEEMEAYPVSKRVGNVGNDDPDLVARA